MWKQQREQARTNTASMFKSAKMQEKIELENAKVDFRNSEELTRHMFKVSVEDSTDQMKQALEHSGRDEAIGKLSETQMQIVNTVSPDACAGCSLNGWSCDAACGFKNASQTGRCAFPGSTDPDKCCTCFSTTTKKSAHSGILGDTAAFAISAANPEDALDTVSTEVLKQAASEASSEVIKASEGFTTVAANAVAQQLTAASDAEAAEKAGSMVDVGALRDAKEKAQSQYEQEVSSALFAQKKAYDVATQQVSLCVSHSLV